MDVTIDCPCPRKADGSPRHESDTVTLRDRLDFDTVTTLRHRAGMIENDGTEYYVAQMLSALTVGYVLFGVERWTLVDEKGKPVPVSHASIRERLMADFMAGQTVGDAADELYRDTVLLPLMLRASRSSRGTPTEPSTSPPTASRERRPRRSSRSSTSTTPTVVTGTTTGPLVGVSSFSPSSESAA